MRRIALILAASLASLAPAAVANAANAATPPSHTVAARACSENWTGFVTPSQNNGSVVWTANSCSWQIRVDLRCVNSRLGLVTHAYGGWVRQVGLHSGATCPDAEPVMTDAYAQYRVGSGSPITTVRYWT
jgi:hypothetical protein